MAKSLRATSVKKNKSALRARVFGPVEAARNERLSAKLLELASQPKPPRPEMDTEDNKDAAKETGATAEEPTDMDVDAGTIPAGKPSKSKREVQRIRAQRAARIDKKRKPQNTRTFASLPKKRKSGGKTR